MTEADVAAELHYFVWMIVVVFAAATLLGALTHPASKGRVALVQATAFTAVGMLATIRPNEVDGQTAFGIPLMWVPFLAVSWLGLLLGARLAAGKSAPG